MHSGCNDILTSGSSASIRLSLMSSVVKNRIKTSWKIVYYVLKQHLEYISECL